MRWWSLGIALSAWAAQHGEIIRMGPGVTPPQIVSKVEPTYTQEAKQAGVQATLLLYLVVNESGQPTDLEVISPVGFGLDESALRAVSQWRFKPGKKDDRPVAVAATIEVNFRFRGTYFDAKAEQLRTSFNAALFNLQKKIKPEEAVKQLESLAAKKLPEAMFTVGTFHATGTWLPKDEARGAELIQAAAAKNYGPAIYEMGRRVIAGQGFPADESKGLAMIMEAAQLGSRVARHELGVRYQTGQGVTQDAERARRYFRLCATDGLSQCQYQLAVLLLEGQPRSEHSFLQALAWLDLAADQGLAPARERGNLERANLTPDQVTWVARLKEQLKQRAK